MGLFDYGTDLKVKLHPDSVIIPPFIDIWNRDKTKTKHRATKELSYVYFLCDFRSPYTIYSEEKRVDKIKEEFIKDTNWEPDSLVLEGIDKYNKFQQTYTMKFLESARGLAEKLQKYFDEVDFSKVDEKGNLVYKATDAVKNLKEVGNVIESLNKVESKVKKEIEDDAKIKGKKIVRGRER